MRLSTAIQLYQKSQHGVLASRSQQIYRTSLSVLLTHIGNVELRRISIDDLRAYRSALLGKHRSMWTVHLHVRICRSFFRWLQAEGKLKNNPATRLELPSLPDNPPKGISESDLSKIRDVARDSESIRDLSIIMFLADTGCRLGGLASLTLDNLDLRHGTAILHEKGRRGKRRTRAVFFTQETASILRAYLKERGDVKTERVFVGRKGALQAPSIYRIIKRLGQKAGVKGCFPHAFRHGFARALLARGLDLSRVSRLLGYSDVRITAQFYGVFEQNELRQAHRRFTWLKPRKA